jgi:hypothetical protein
MGNYNFRQAPIPAGKTAIIVHDRFTKDEKLSDDVIRAGQKVKVLGTTNMQQSRPNAKPITISKVLFSDGSSDIYLTNNLKPL